MQNTISMEFVIAITALYPYFTIKVNVEDTFVTLQFIKITSRTYVRLSESDICNACKTITKKANRCHIPPENFSNPKSIWIKLSMYTRSSNIPYRSLFRNLFCSKFKNKSNLFIPLTCQRQYSVLSIFVASLTITRHDKFECYSQVCDANILYKYMTIHITAQAVKLLEHKLSHFD